MRWFIDRVLFLFYLHPRFQEALLGSKKADELRAEIKRTAKFFADQLQLIPRVYQQPGVVLFTSYKSCSWGVVVVDGHEVVLQCLADVGDGRRGVTVFSTNPRTEVPLRYLVHAHRALRRASFMILSNYPEVVDGRVDDLRVIARYKG